MRSTRPALSKITQSVVSAGVFGIAKTNLHCPSQPTVRSKQRCHGFSLGLTLRLPDDSDIRSPRLPSFRIDLLRLFVRNRSRDDHVVALFPVDWRGDAMLRGELHRIDHAENLIEIAPGGHGIDQDQLDLLVRANDEDVTNRLIVGWRPPLGRT